MEIKNPQINKAIDYIFLNLMKDITVEDVAKHCHVSKFHFNRLFREHTGESIYSLIKRLRLEESAIVLASNNSNSITDIGLGYGYSPSNYSSAFTKHLGCSPAKFRKLKKDNKIDIRNPFSGLEFIYKDFHYYNDRVSINHLKDMKVIYKRYIASYKEMSKLWPLFIEQNKAYIDDNTQLIEICYNDPNITKIDRCLFDLCIANNKNLSTENTRKINGGRFATLSSKGSENDIVQDYKGFLNIWLPKSGFVIDRRIKFDTYQHVDPENGYFEIDINIPIKE